MLCVFDMCMSTGKAFLIYMLDLKCMYVNLLKFICNWLLII